MNLPWRGGFLLLALAFQDPAPPPVPDLVARYTEILTKGPENQRDLAARALLSLGRPGYGAYKEALAVNPDLAKSAPPLGAPPALSLVRFPRDPQWEQKCKDALATRVEGLLVRCPVEAESVLWEALNSPDKYADAQARSALRALYAAPPDPAIPLLALGRELDQRRSFDVSEKTLAEVMEGEDFSWILMAPRPERISLKLRDVSLRDFLRMAAPDWVAIPIRTLLILIPRDRVALVEPPLTAWASTDLAPRLESALVALTLNETGPIKALTGVTVYHALRRSLRLNAEAGQLADDLRKQLQQRVYFIDEREERKGALVSLEPRGRKTAEMLAEFERLSKRAIKVRSNDVLDQRAPDFRFKDIPAEQAARALEFRLNYLR